MAKIKRHDTGPLVIPKTVLLEAYRGNGPRQHIVEVTHQDVDSPSKEILSYTSFLTKYGQRLDPGHKQTLENCSRPWGFPVAVKGDDDGDGEEKEHGRAFLRPPLGNKNAPSLPVLREGGQGEGGQRGRDKEPRKRGRRPRNPLLHRLLTRAHLETLCADHTQAQIAQEVGCSKGYLCLKLKDFGLKAVSGHLPKTDQDQEIIRLAKTKTIGELAEHFGKSRTTIFQKLARLGITAVRGTPGKPKGRKP